MISICTDHVHALRPVTLRTQDSGAGIWKQFIAERILWSDVTGRQPCSTRNPVAVLEAVADERRCASAHDAEIFAPNPQVILRRTLVTGIARDPNYCRICTPKGLGYCQCDIACNE